MRNVHAELTTNFDRMNPALTKLQWPDMLYIATGLNLGICKVSIKCWLSIPGSPLVLCVHNLRRSWYL